MKLSPNNLKSIDKSTPSQFELVFAPLQLEREEVASFSINLHTLSLPGVDISPEERQWMGSKLKHPGGLVDFGDWTVDFMVDEYLQNWLSFFRWITWINNNRDSATIDFESLKTDASLLIKDNWNTTIHEFRFIGLWPSSLGSIELSARNATEYLESSVTFSYDSYELLVTDAPRGSLGDS